MSDTFKGQISLADYFSYKAFWFNDEGMHVAGGRPGREFNTVNPDSYGYNFLIGDKLAAIKYNDKILSRWDEDSIDFLDKNNETSASFGTEGMFLNRGVISLKNIVSSSDGQNSEITEVLLDENGLYINLPNPDSSDLNKMFSFTIDGFFIDSSYLQINSEGVRLKETINIEGTLTNGDVCLNLIPGTDKLGFYKYENDEIKEPILNFINYEPSATVLNVNRLVFLNIEDNTQVKFSFIKRANNHLSLKIV